MSTALRPRPTKVNRRVSHSATVSPYRSVTSQSTELIEIDDAISMSLDSDPKVRAEAVRILCPCQLQTDVPRVWDRLIQMAQDESLVVRRNVFHVLADGSPRYREQEIVSVFEIMQNDPDITLRRRVRKLLAQYRRGGRLNIL